jgi:eukaryotic-like serine/threonine-protein kinase
MNRLLKGIGAVLLLIFAGAASAVIVIAILLRQEEVRVPDLTSQDIVTVVETLSQQGLQVKVDRREPSQSVPKDSIISQSPAPGTGIKKGRAVRLVVSLGPSEFLAPRLVGEQYRKAEFLLRQGGLLPPDAAWTWSDKADRNTVIAQDPPAGAPLEQGARVGILVSLGKKGRVYAAPTLVGKRADDAVRALDRLGFQHRITTRPTATERPAGERIVAAQRPLPGYPLPADSMVELEVSR